MATDQDQKHTLLELLVNYPIINALGPHLTLGSLLNLARTNSGYRAVLHDFPRASNEELDAAEIDLPVRSFLRIGYHDTYLWRRLKNLSSYECCWPGHVKGGPPTGCVSCSKPVCEACIVRNDFKRCISNSAAPSFRTRARSLCSTCWSSGNPHYERLRFGPASSTPKIGQYTKEICECTGKKGVLCWECKGEQNRNLDSKLSRCAGYGCGVSLEGSHFTIQICLWCNFMIPKSRHDEAALELSNSVRDVVCAPREVLDPMPPIKKRRRLPPLPILPELTPPVCGLPKPRDAPLAALGLGSTVAGSTSSDRRPIQDKLSERNISPAPSGPMPNGGGESSSSVTPPTQLDYTWTYPVTPASVWDQENPWNDFPSRSVGLSVNKT
jgi:hypothetical protein